ncbi:TPM domain-containing protein [Actimicrobium antarcticum]|uniref:TPM domain-containing protein n=1 Tax=Actimicrobium antarcticum TaxID=1051899 RepID=A0ABP7TUF1_9BURK
MHLLKRLWRHGLTTSAAGRRAFPPATLREIQTTIAGGERVHRAEIKVIIEAALDMMDVLEKKSARERARELFSEYRIWDTEENSGVLLYVNLADRKVEIIADRGVNTLLTRTDWHAVCAMMTSGFASSIFHDSVIAALNELNRLLQQHAPSHSATDSGGNDLSDTPVML